MAPLVLGIVLGELLDRNLRRAFTLADGDYAHFFTRPISAVIAVAILALILAQVPAVQRLMTRMRTRWGSTGRDRREPG
jgi:putative tricarboxylic transport membrane protein